ncbi:DUF190 domain-containing protein [Caulobacter hibisci]|uniref:DUF190 domain-containing protein n=1 Tax=Caulobacter hibisci TaxID=2035993 RepID=A0ABS0SVE7_9CAUL|nr:DUF190 domain-containing protein [Caulobacter hibisci]MBI1683622.1 DUF190 domain-containing protein [Caulobacter hibisci]
MASDRLHLLRVYTDADAILEGQPYAQALLARARTLGVANGAILQVIDAYGDAGIVHGAKAVDLAPRRHVIVELVDEEPRLRGFLDSLGQGEEVGLVTLETIAIVAHGGHRHHAKS